MPSAPGNCRSGRTRRNCRFQRGSPGDCPSCCGFRWSLAVAGSDSPCRSTEMIRLLPTALIAIVIASVAASPSISDDAAPFQAHVDMKPFMEHVLSPAAAIILRGNGTVIDEKGEHDLSPKTDDDSEQHVSGAAPLAEATNALMIPEHPRDPDSNP